MNDKKKVRPARRRDDDRDRGGEPGKVPRGPEGAARPQAIPAANGEVVEGVDFLCPGGDKKNCEQRRRCRVIERLVEQPRTAVGK